MTLWNHGLSTYDCLSGGGGNGLVALSDDKEVLLLEWGNVADFLSGDLSENSSKTHVKVHVSFAIHSFRSWNVYWKCVKIWFEAKCFTNLLNSGGLEWERPESNILKDSLDDESQCLRTRFFLDLRWLSPFSQNLHVHSEARDYLQFFTRYLTDVHSLIYVLSQSFILRRSPLLQKCDFRELRRVWSWMTESKIELEETHCFPS